MESRPATDQTNFEMRDAWDLAPPRRQDVLQWARDHSKWRAWRRLLHWRRHLGIADECRTIEVGCGYGKMSLLLGLAGADVTLLDYNPSALEAAAAAHALVGLRPNLRQADLSNLPGDLLGRFDVACSFGTLEHFFGEHRAAAFAATVSTLRPGGLLLFTVPNRHAIWYRIAFGLRYRAGKMPGGFTERPFSLRELQRLAVGAGVAPLEIEAIDSFAGDFKYWIGENVRGGVRKLTGRPRPRAEPAAADLDVADLAIAAREAADSEPEVKRSFLDRKASYSLLFAGKRLE